jgi:hypothetical protein
LGAGEDPGGKAVNRNENNEEEFSFYLRYCIFSGGLEAFHGAWKLFGDLTRYFCHL